MKALSFLSIAAIVLFASCTEQQRSGKSRGPIILGDSATIVTETDPKLLEDMLPDLRPLSSEGTGEGQRTATADTTRTATAEPAKPTPPPPSGNGLTAAFKEVTVFIPNVTGRTYGRSDLQNARSVTYGLTGGHLAGNQLRITGGNVQRVTQRYQTIIGIKRGSEILPLDNLTHTSASQALTGSNGVYTISGLEPSRLGYNNARPAAIRSAVQQAARRKRMSRQETREWEAAVRNIRAANQAPATVLLRYVTWRIEGKDDRGRSFNKEVRIDLPQ